MRKVLFFVSLVFMFTSCSESEYIKSEIELVASVNDAGLWSSDLDVHDGKVYVVDSGNNTINMIDLSDFSLHKNYIDLGENASPYAVRAYDDYIYVASQGFGYVKAYETNNVSSSFTFKSDLIAPADICETSYGVFISDSEYNMLEPEKSGGNIYGDGVKFPSSINNTGFLHTFEFGGDTYIAAVGAGIIDFINDKNPDRSCVDIWKLPLVDFKPTYTVCVPDTSLGRMTFNHDTLFVGDGTKAVIHYIPMISMIVGDSTMQSINLNYNDRGLSVPVSYDNRLIATDFNTAEIFLFDSSMEVVSVLSQPGMENVKGIIDAEYDSKYGYLVVLNSLSESVDIFRVKE